MDAGPWVTAAVAGAVAAVAAYAWRGSAKKASTSPPSPVLAATKEDEPDIEEVSYFDSVRCFLRWRARADAW